MKIENCKLKIALAPMAGISDSAFRLMNKFGGADKTYSEMAHVNAISYNSKKTLTMLKASPFEFPYIVQLFGKDPKYFAQAAKIISTRGVPVMRYEPFSKARMEFIEKFTHPTLVTLGHPSREGTDSGKSPLERGRSPQGGRGVLLSEFPAFQSFYSRFLDFQNQLQSPDPINFISPSGLDINLGCPAKKVFGHGGGAALWKDLKNVRAILEAVLKNTDLPVSIKVRTAVGKVTLFDLLDSIKDLPIKSVMIHGRTYAQGFNGPIDTELIRRAIKKYPQFKFWVNGGIYSPKDAKKIMSDVGTRHAVFGLGIARGTYGNPLLAEEIKNTKFHTPRFPTRKSGPTPARTYPARMTLSGLPFGTGGPLKRGIIPIVETRHAASHVESNNVLCQCILAYIHSTLAYQSKGKHGIVEMRKHLAWYFKDFPNAKDWRKKLVLVKNVKEIEKILSGIVA